MKILFPTLVAIFLCFSSCSKNNTNETTSGTTDFSVYLTDDPSLYDEVNIDIQRVEVHFSDDADSSAWHTINIIHPGVHNLLRLANGKDTLLAKQRIASGRISQVRFILGNNNSAVIDGISFPLKTPSAQESGLKFNVDATLTAGIEYKLWTDFDAARSIVVTGNHEYILKPVIRVYTEALTGSIIGNVLPYASKPWVYVLNGNDTIASASPDSLTGKFMINGLSAGSYDVLIDGNNNFSDTTYNGVEVSTGNITDLGTTLLHQ